MRVKLKGSFLLHLDFERSLVPASPTVVSVSAFPESRGLAMTQICHLVGSGEYCATCLLRWLFSEVRFINLALVFCMGKEGSRPGIFLLLFFSF